MKINSNIFLEPKCNLSSKQKKQVGKKIETLKSQLRSLHNEDKLIRHKEQDAKKFMSASNIYNNQACFKAIEKDEAKVKAQIACLQEQI